MHLGAHLEARGAQGWRSAMHRLVAGSRRRLRARCPATL